MIDALRRRLRARRSGQEPAGEPRGEDVPESLEGAASPEREEEFSAYTEDCRVFGFLRVGAERLSDALNEQDEFRLQSVLVVALEDGRASESRELVVRRDELIAVRAAGPRGNSARRARTRPSPVTLKAGPYVVHGYVHAPPGADPLQHIRRRKPMVPLTSAWIEYHSMGERHRARVGTIVVNRERLEWVGHSRDAEVRVDLPLEARIDPRAKDMTGHVRVFRSDESPVEEAS